MSYTTDCNLLFVSIIEMINPPICHCLLICNFYYILFPVFAFFFQLILSLNLHWNVDTNITNENYWSRF